MTGPVLKKDVDIRFPHVTVLKASAGSGKTHTLTKRYVQFLLSERIPRNGLRNVLAITFSNNAAKEMKERVLQWLKAVYFEDPERLEEVLQVTSLGRSELHDKAGQLIDRILDNYADFQIRTIDSFMATVFKSSAIDFGYNPDFEILLDNSQLMAYSFDLFLRQVREGSPEAQQMGEIVDFLLDDKKTDAAYLWDPSAALLEEIIKIYEKLSATGKRPKIDDLSRPIKKVKDSIAAAVEEIEAEIEGSGLKRHGASSYRTVLGLVRARSFPDLIGKTFTNPPVTKLRKEDAGHQASYDRIVSTWSEVSGLIGAYTVLYARARCMPYLRAYQAFSRTVELVKRQQGRIFIEDISRHLAEYLSGDIVPDIYFRLGETVFHFLIDEFQDTSPIQWQNLFPLIENSLAQGGSLFAVGDTKQAIYGFRNADYAIMKGLETDNPFPSALHDVRELDMNYRSLRCILDFNEEVFKVRAAGHAEYQEAGQRSGLTSYIQKAREESRQGYAGVIMLDRNDEAPPERVALQALIAELCGRGYQFGDIAVLTQKNEDAVRATSWLNEQAVPFISYSSLDVRRRKITGEVVALLNFLDSPTDDFSFGTFILGDIFSRVLQRGSAGPGMDDIRDFCFRKRNEPPLYKAFQQEFGAIWSRYFEGLFRSAGFFPLYDLVTEVFAVFRVFETAGDEEATLVKILEVVKDFEGAGFNTLRDFLETAEEEGGEAVWNMDVPKHMNAVRVMTIHKAKGLGFPVVIVLLYETRNRGFDYLVEEGDEEVSLLKLNQATAACDPSFQALYDAQRMKEKVSRLNSLYVGFTRPESELYVIGLQTRQKGHPFDLLPAAAYPPPQMPECCPSAGCAAIPSVRALHHQKKVEVPEGGPQSISPQERRRGEFIHRVLYFIEHLGDDLEAGLAGMISRAAAETGTDPAAEDIGSLILRLVSGPEMAAYFRDRPGRRIMKEQEFSDETGRLFRMDRVVVDPDKVVVIDYKTGKEPDDEKYRQQIKAYMQILGQVYPGRVIEGIIAFVDLGEVRRLS
ncbi:MAG: hypothetical protein EPN25_00855 [Nitrospirae bacterium]|nr:MAG: hypothetical protein EPN25_00855 [Nitrospirota bacterium]